MNKIIESLKNIYKDNKYIFSIQILICSFFAFLLGLSRGARSHSRLERIMAEYISSKVGFDFHPVWLCYLCPVARLLIISKKRRKEYILLIPAYIKRNLRIRRKKENKLLNRTRQGCGFILRKIKTGLCPERKIICHLSTLLKKIIQLKS